MMVLGAIVEGVYGQLARGRRRYDGGERIRGDFMVRDCLGGPVLVGFLTLSPVTLLAGSSLQVPGTHWRCSLWPGTFGGAFNQSCQQKACSISPGWLGVMGKLGEL